MAPELMLRTSRDRKGYRLKCRFKIEPYPNRSRLEVEKVRVAERFVRDLRAQGWENLPGYGFKMRGPFPQVEPVDIKRPHVMTAKQMLPRIMRGERFLDKGRDYAKAVPRLGAAAYWEFEISGIFSREEVLVERPDDHEERH